MNIEAKEDVLEVDQSIEQSEILPEILLFRRGIPLSYDIRARVMKFLSDGLSAAEIARRLKISKRTVWRYKKAADAQKKSVPKPLRQGGYRASVALLNRDKILKIGNILIENPKLNIKELKQKAVTLEILDQMNVPSDVTIWRAMKKLGLKFKRANYVDPQTLPSIRNSSSSSSSTESAASISNKITHLIVEEQQAFRTIQKQGTAGQLNPYELLFMDCMINNIMHGQLQMVEHCLNDQKDNLQLTMS